MTDAMGEQMTVADVERFLETAFPQLEGAKEAGRDSQEDDRRHYTVVSVGPATATMRLDPGIRHLRPGGTVSGPSLFTLADVGCWVAILAQIGPQEMVVTTNLTINFLRLPKQKPVDCDCRILKLGRRLAVVEALMHQGNPAEPVAHATGTYSIPPANGR